MLVGNVLGAPHRRDSFLIGFMLVGPHNTYPNHAHAAHEAYHIIAGIVIRVRSFKIRHPKLIGPLEFDS